MRLDLDYYDALKNYTVVAAAMETIHDVEHDEIDGAFIWVVYHNDNDRLYVSRLDIMSGELREFARMPYTTNRDYAEVFAAAMLVLYEHATGRDFATAVPRR